MKKVLILIVTAALAAVSCTCGNRDKNKEASDAPVLDPMDGPVVEMTTTLGEMKIKLYNATPKHRDNFVKLTDEGFFDGIRFHRVIEGFMIQGGDPLSKDDENREQWGTGGPGYTIAAEFVPELHHCKGAVAAARMGDLANPRRASSGSQFYIVQNEDGCRHLDGEYTVFGQVIEGLEVIDAIAAVQTDPYDRPLTAVEIVSAKVLRPIVEEVADSTAVADSAAVAAGIGAADGATASESASAVNAEAKDATGDTKVSTAGTKVFPVETKASSPVESTPKASSKPANSISPMESMPVTDRAVKTRKTK